MSFSLGHTSLPSLKRRVKVKRRKLSNPGKQRGNKGWEDWVRNSRLDICSRRRERERERERGRERDGRERTILRPGSNFPQGDKWVRTGMAAWVSVETAENSVPQIESWHASLALSMFPRPASYCRNHLCCRVLIIYAFKVQMTEGLGTLLANS